MVWRKLRDPASLEETGAINFDPKIKYTAIAQTDIQVT